MTKAALVLSTESMSAFGSFNSEMFQNVFTEKQNYEVEWLRDHKQELRKATLTWI